MASKTTFAMGQPVARPMSLRTAMNPKPAILSPNREGAYACQHQRSATSSCAPMNCRLRHALVYVSAVWPPFSTPHISVALGTFDFERVVDKMNDKKQKPCDMHSR